MQSPPPPPLLLLQLLLLQLFSTFFLWTSSTAEFLGETITSCATNQSVEKKKKHDPPINTWTWNINSNLTNLRSMSFLISLFPDWSSIITLLVLLLSLLTRLTKMGVSSPSSSKNPFANAAAVFITRPSSEVLIFRSCRNVLCVLCLRKNHKNNQYKKHRRPADKGTGEQGNRGG